MNEKALRAGFIDIYFSLIKHVEADLSRPLEDFKLSFEQYQIMTDLASNEATTLTDIVKRRKVTKPAIARQLRVLRDLGYVSQTTAKDDRRRRLLQLTPLGKRVEAEAIKASNAAFDQWVQILGKDKLLALLNMLQDAEDQLHQAQTPR
ncbi:MarR family winged helix-turn-helix transcriptional regulator [Lacticaseibacillus sp. 53-4]|uniref:MarR family winged helix-turn-helix transcriptional regulator n=1 Tax=Lacticaseibacillus sp. 53-4 TaxID=2799575 RepID=UPI001944B9AC|nr:MarR family transcriptional regulator [Lacticaseibacillus sp. 53-4]